MSNKSNVLAVVTGVAAGGACYNAIDGYGAFSAIGAGLAVTLASLTFAQVMRDVFGRGPVRQRSKVNQNNLELKR